MKQPIVTVPENDVLENQISIFDLDMSYNDKNGPITSNKEQQQPKGDLKNEAVNKTIRSDT